MLSDKAAIVIALERASIPATELKAAFAAAHRYREQLQSEEERAPALAAITERVELRTDRLRLTIALRCCLAKFPDAGSGDPVLVRDIPLRLRRRGVEMRLVFDNTPPPAEPDPVFLKETRRAHRCFDALVTGRVASLGELARKRASATAISAVCCRSPCSLRIWSRQSSAGASLPKLTTHRLIRATNLPITWRDQKAALGHC